MNVLGIMNGTSMDGVDFVLCQMSAQTLRFKAASATSFPPLLAKRLRLATENKMAVKDLALLHYDLGHFYTKSILRLKRQKKWKIDLIGLHGQTVFHESGKVSLQIGEPSFAAATLKVPVISDFRSADIAAGGEGAPLAGLFHRVLAKQNKLSNISFHNIGGISNLTYLNKKTEISFDTGPGNMLMDIYCQKYLKKPFDKFGQTAAKGLADIKLVQTMMVHPYFKKPAPKTCGRENFGETFLKKYEKRLRSLGHKNAMATLSTLTAYSIAAAYKQQLPSMPDEIIFCGGGANNKNLLKQISYYLPEVDISTTKSLNWNPQHIEAAAFAYLAYQRYKKKKIDARAFTGAKEKSFLGKITL